MKREDQPLGEILKSKIYEHLNNFLDQVWKISNLKKGDIVFTAEVQPMDMDFFAHVVLETNAYYGYITVIDTNDYELKYLYSFHDFVDLWQNENPTKIPTDEDILELKNKIYKEEKNIVSQVLSGEYDYLLEN